MDLQVKNIKGQSVKKVAVPDGLFDAEMNEHVLHLVVKAYQANRRQGTHATKTRSFVSGGGKKPFKQKGTGGARQGSSRSPLQPGGGQSHGPQPRDYTQKLNKNLKRLALKVALSDKVRNNKLIVIDDFGLSKHSTKHVVDILKSLKISKALLADERKDDWLYRSARNIYGTASLSPSEINAEQLLKYDSVVITETALNVLKQRLESDSNESV